MPQTSWVVPFRPSLDWPVFGYLLNFGLQMSHTRDENHFNLS